MLITVAALANLGSSLGLACSVLWLGALGDRFSRKLLLILGATLAMQAALIAAFAPTIEVMIAGSAANQAQDSSMSHQA